MEKKTVTWVLEPFRFYFTHHLEMERLLNLWARGSSLFMDTYAKGKKKEHEPGVPAEEIAARLDRAELAQDEANNGYPRLFSQAAILLWGSLETFVRDFAVAWLAKVPGAKQVEAVCKIKITFGDYQEFDDEELCYFIIKSLEQNSGAPLKNGVARFDFILKTFNLGGNIDAQVKSDLYELSKVRNVLVHNRGIADKKFIKDCHHLKLNVGDQVVVTNQSYHRYVKSTNLYLLSLLYSAGKQLNLNLPDYEQTKSRMIGGSSAAGWFD